MKIIEDKVAVHPPHALSKRDVAMLVAAIPEEWLAGIDTIRLSNAPAYGQRLSPPALLRPYARSLTASTRGLEKEVAVREILRELAANGRGLRVRRHHFSGRDLEILDRVVEPFVQTIVSRLSTKKIHRHFGVMRGPSALSTNKPYRRSWSKKRA